MRGIIYFHIKWKESALADSSFYCAKYLNNIQKCIKILKNMSKKLIM